MKRITPESMVTLTPKQMVTIGTNESGINGAGIAFFAEKNWGWPAGRGFGPAGQCFGIPTKDWNIKQLPLDVIEFYVSRYIKFIRSTPMIEHMITKIGCGLAGYTVPEIAPLFITVATATNVWLPQDFRDFYSGTYEPMVDVKINTNGRTEIYRDGKLSGSQG